MAPRLLKIVVTAACLAAAGVPVAQAQAQAPAQAPGPVITVHGNQLLRNGVPWIPRGVQIVGLVAPDGALSGKYVAAHQQFGLAELQAAAADHADVVRFQVSEFGLDPQGPLYSPGYAQEVQSAVQMARGLGLAVIVSLQAQPPAGEPTRCPLPDAGAQRAWSVLAAMFAGDSGVMFELYNEPGVSATPAGWIQWRAGGEIIYPGGSCEAVGMPALIASIRTLAPQNVIIVPALAGEQSLSGRLRLTDPAHRGDPQLAYGIHYPSLSRGSTFWDKTFGDASAAVPVIVTEWDANSTTSCVADAPTRAQLLLDYLAGKRIGIVGFAFDLPGTIVTDASGTPTSFAGFACGVAGGGPGELLFGDFAAEAQAGDGTRPDPGPAWIVGVAALSRLEAAGAAQAQQFFDSPRTFVTAASAATLTRLGVPTAIATGSFANEATLAAAVNAGRLRPGTEAVVYDPGDTPATPAVQQADPARFFALAAQVAHAHGLLLVAAPAMSLVAGLTGGTPNADSDARDAAFLRLGIAAAAARAADVVAIPAQGTGGYAGDYAVFVSAAARQAARAHPGIELLAGLTAAGTDAEAAADSLFGAYLSTRVTVSGYALDPPSSAAAAAFLRTVSRLA
ncbi:MAG TPA: cellulase family glycosylhydrolase [Solirubrobacteraceae bacterium]